MQPYAVLTSAEAAVRLCAYGENNINAKKSASPLLLFLGQFKSPLILIMLVATAISAATGDWLDSLISFAIVLGSAVLNFLQEYSASNASAKLRSHIQMQCTVLRDGTPALPYATIGIAAQTLILPYLTLSSILNITPIPPAILLALLGVAALYIIVTEIAKHFFFHPRKQPVVVSGVALK